MESAAELIALDAVRADADLSLLDWQERIRTRRSLIPPGARQVVDLERANRAVGIFNKLRLPDVPGNPPLEDAAGEWFREIVATLLGAIDPATKQRTIREVLLLASKKSSK